MMGRLADLIRNARGAGAVEFALVAPAFIFLVNGIAQLGIVFFAHAGLHNAVAEGARYATVFPHPTETQVKNLVAATRWGLDPSKLIIDKFTYHDVGGTSHVDITMRYSVDPNLIFIDVAPIELVQTRRAYLYPTSKAPAPATS